MIQDYNLGLLSLPKLSQVLSQSDFLTAYKAFMSQISSHMITPAAISIGPCDLHPPNRSQRSPMTYYSSC